MISASTFVAEKDRKHWFQQLENYMKKGLEDVIAESSRVFNGDESGFQINPDTGKVHFQRDSNNVYTIDRGSSKENITVYLKFVSV